MTQQFSTYNIIQKKRDKGKLSKEEIHWFINGLTEGHIADYQMSALLMAIYLNGMDITETAELTDAMLYSGKVLNFPEQHFIDKHSTGGVGDKASFILAPIAAACGVKVPMIAGRGLGHTGGTIDKIESIKGFKTDISLEEFEKLLHERGVVLIGQTKDIAPADKKIYALRDVTATIESIPLITASIMSKKLAEGAKGIVMDIKTGNGAFMSKLSDAKT
jgi:pyrimidine-nucleoside phosphorylase